MSAKLTSDMNPPFALHTTHSDIELHPNTGQTCAWNEGRDFVEDAEADVRLDAHRRDVLVSIELHSTHGTRVASRVGGISGGQGQASASSPPVYIVRVWYSLHQTVRTAIALI